MNYKKMKKDELIEMIRELKSERHSLKEKLANVQDSLSLMHKNQRNLALYLQKDWKMKGVESYIKNFRHATNKAIQCLKDNGLWDESNNTVPKSPMTSKEIKHAATPKKDYSKIQQNTRCIYKVASEDQIMLLMKKCAYFEVTIGVSEIRTVAQADNTIQAIQRRIDAGDIKRRETVKYTPEQLFNKFIEKYPDFYNEVMNRNL